MATKAKLDPPLVARNGHKLEVMIICRVSDAGPGKQDEKSLDDQEADQSAWLGEHTELPFEITVIAGSGSGEYLDRKEVEKAQAELETGRYDLILAEDLGRHLRRMQAYLFCEAAEDIGTRLIARNDFLDTAHSDWRLCAFFAAMRHEMYNSDTARRIRRSLRNRFTLGGIFQLPIYGYIKPPETKRDDEVRKDPAAETIYDEWFKKLEGGGTYAEVGDWLNELGIPVGPYCRQDKWDGRMVARVTMNPILKGQRVRNNRISKRINKTGRRKSVKAPPEERLERDCPHLAFIEPSRYDRVIEMLKNRNAKYRRNGDGGPDVRANVPKKRTRFPGQMIDCGICGRQFVFGGHGQTDHLMCMGAREHVCWNGITVDGPLATEKISLAVFVAIESLESFDPVFLSRLDDDAARLDSVQADLRNELSAKLAKNERETANLVRFLRNSDEDDPSPSVCKELKSLETLQTKLRYEIDEIDRTPRTSIAIPCIDEVKRLARESFQDLAADSFEFANAMRKLIGRITVFPYRLCDGTPIVLRARFDLCLANLLPAKREQELLRPQLIHSVSVDLFNPSQRVAFRNSVLELRTGTTGRKPMSERLVASTLGLTVTAAQRAAALDRIMRSRGLTDPYVPLLEPPLDYPKLRRHLHPRYRLSPLPGFPIEPW